MKECTFLSIQTDETTDISTTEQLIVIIHLDRKGEIFDSFLKFTDVSTDRTAPTINDTVKKIIERYGPSLEDKVIMQTYDGATVMPGHLGAVQALVCQDYPCAYFFHCAAYRLNPVLCQSPSSVSSVKIFLLMSVPLAHLVVSALEEKNSSGLITSKFPILVKPGGTINPGLLVSYIISIRIS